VRALQQRKKKIFLDLKLHDIPNTVAGAVASAARLGVALLTVHAGGGRKMLQAAADAKKEFGTNAPRLVAVTALTSLGQADLAELGIQRALPEQVLALGELALGSGLDGLVCSVHEAAALRQRFGPAPLLVTPGIRPSYAQGATEGRPSPAQGATEGRPAGPQGTKEGKPSRNPTDDQKRVATPAMAVWAGASFLVVGRPILDAADPAAAAAAILLEMEAAAG
jgi:orotidine-5'-phosphate decarboxylase